MDNIAKLKQMMVVSSPIGDMVRVIELEIESLRAEVSKLNAQVETNANNYDELSSEYLSRAELAEGVAARMEDAVKALLYKPPEESKSKARVPDGRTVEEVVLAALRPREKCSENCCTPGGCVPTETEPAQTKLSALREADKKAQAAYALSNTPDGLTAFDAAANDAAAAEIELIEQLGKVASEDECPELYRLMLIDAFTTNPGSEPRPDNCYMECPCCGDVAAGADKDGYFADGQDVTCGCEGLSVSCCSETPPYVSGDCTVDHDNPGSEGEATTLRNVLGNGNTIVCTCEKQPCDGTCS